VQIVLIPVLGFISGLIAVWGKRALAMSFSVLFISVITVGSPPLQGPVQLAAAVALFFIGALLYTAYALLLARWLRRRTKEQALAELLAQLGQFAHWLANHFGAQSSGLSGAVAQLTAINDTLQNTRDIVLRDVRTAADRALAARLILLLEVNEALLASQTDGDLILKQFDATPVPDALRDWAQRIGDALDQRADALLRGTPANTLPAHLPCAQTIEHALATLQPSQPSAEFAAGPHGLARQCRQVSAHQRSARSRKTSRVADSARSAAGHGSAGLSQPAALRPERAVAIHPL
jgi:hypothetical protein